MVARVQRGKYQVAIDRRQTVGHPRTLREQLRPSSWLKIPAMDSWQFGAAANTIASVFLERKFAARDEKTGGYEPASAPVLPRQDWTALPALVYDVVSNIQLVLKARRGYHHVLPDYGLTPVEGCFSGEGLLERVLFELPTALLRYEPRFTLLSTDVETDDAGQLTVRVAGTIRGLSGSLHFTFGVVGRKILGVEFHPEKSGPR